MSYKYETEKAGRNAVIEVRQIGADKFTYCERGTYDKGVLVGAFQNGKAVA